MMCWIAFRRLALSIRVSNVFREPVRNATRFLNVFLIPELLIVAD